MFFQIKNNRYLSTDQLRLITLANAYNVIKNYTLGATELPLDKFITQQYNTSLRNVCVKLLLSLSFYEDNDGNLVLLFKDFEHDKLARLITYGNGAIPGSRILQVALHG